MLCAGLNSVQAAGTIPVTSTDESGPNTLRDAIANAADGDTIVLAVPTQPGETAVFQMSTIFDDADNFMGPTATPIKSTIIIEARGSRLEHVPDGVNFGAFAVGPGGDLTIRNAHIKGFTVKGGDGAVAFLPRCSPVVHYQFNNHQRSDGGSHRSPERKQS